MSTMPFFDYPVQYRHSTGMVDNLVSIGLGVEDAGDLIDDLSQAFDKT